MGYYYKIQNVLYTLDSSDYSTFVCLLVCLFLVVTRDA